MDIVIGLLFLGAFVGAGYYIYTSRKTKEDFTSSGGNNTSYDTSRNNDTLEG